MRIARDEAARLGHDCIDTEHVLLALLDEDAGIAATALKGLRLDRERVIEALAEEVEIGEAVAVTGQMPFTSEARDVLVRSLEEARSLGHPGVGPEHLLLGLVRDAEGVAMRTLTRLGVTGEDVRSEVRRLLS
jgi:ATP-dependent Clp protease ATP-binding subunit ClpC